VGRAIVGAREPAIVTQAEFAQGESTIGDYLHRTPEAIDSKREQLRRRPDDTVLTTDDSHIATNAHAHRDSGRGRRARLEQPTALLHGHAKRLARQRGSISVTEQRHREEAVHRAARG
jgi:hypothetical protein